MQTLAALNWLNDEVRNGGSGSEAEGQDQRLLTFFLKAICEWIKAGRYKEGHADLAGLNWLNDEVRNWGLEVKGQDQRLLTFSLKPK